MVVLVLKVLFAKLLIDLAPYWLETCFWAVEFDFLIYPEPFNAIHCRASAMWKLRVSVAGHPHVWP